MLSTLITQSFVLLQGETNFPWIVKAGHSLPPSLFVPHIWNGSQAGWSPGLSALLMRLAEVTMAGSEPLVKQPVCSHLQQTHPLKSEKLWRLRGLTSSSQPFLAGTAGSAEAHLLLTVLPACFVLSNNWGKSGNKL